MPFKTGTVITTYTGEKKLIENLKIGDTLTSSDGNPTKIKEIKKINCTLYEVKQKKGETYVVSEEHLLNLKFTNVKNIIWEDILVYLNTSKNV